MSLLNVIKNAGLQAVSATDPVSVFYGTVESIAPLAVKVDQRFTLTSEFLVIPHCLTRYEVDLSHHHGITGGEGEITPSLGKLVIREGLQPGDRVILMRIQGGQQYLVLEKEGQL